MPNLTLYHLTPHSAFHLGQRGIGQEETGVHLPSDSLFAALVAAYVEAGNQPDDLTRGFSTQPAESSGTTAPFLLTSAFPRAGQVRFYPALPLSLWPLAGEKKENRLKELRAVQFISEAIFKKIVAGEALDEWLPRQDENDITGADQGLYLQGKTLWLTAAEVEQLPNPRQQKNDKTQRYRALRHLRVWQIGKAPRVTVDRLRNASNIFHTGRLSFSPDCGWWFGLAWRQKDPASQQAVAQALQLLGDVGLGGERAVGYGHFNCREVGQMDWPEPTPQQPFVTLSRYHPRPTELPGALQDDPVAYKLAPVGGWLNSLTSGQAKAQRRRRLWLVAEGSAVRAVGAGPWGDVVDVRPLYPEAGVEFPHPVWRYGLACPVRLAG